MSTQTIFGIISSFLTISGAIVYIINILKRKDKPAKAAWVIWTLISALLLVSYIATNVPASAWQAFDIKKILGILPPVYFAISVLLGNAAVMVLALKYGQAGWKKIDKICLVGALLSMVVWYLSGSAFIALLMNLTMDAFGVINLIYSCYHNYSQENIIAWILFSVSAFIAVLAIPNFSFYTATLPIYILCVDTLTLGTVLYKTKLVKR
ncbi:MAG: hypothetical protein WCW27_03225 [Patescibacteria group bacterium]|jgi:hypothetical protein